mmetsp:Transcript_87150/g.177627  ORF Transcript_87150/g.177627 Transcript_87150/m.177627 type:complete len:371 (+) Transcript_87150:240-1352(+)
MAAGSILSSSSNILTSIALKKVVKPPNMVANALDWKKASGGVATAMAIDIHADRIGLALGTLENNNHNNNHSNSITSDYDSNDATMMKLMMRGSTTSSHHPSSLDQQQHHNHYLGYGFSCTVLDSILLVKEGDESSSQSNNNSNIRRKRKKKVVPREDKLRLSGLVREHNVCGFVVSWPIQQDTGLMGASCGRTLWTLEQLLFDGGGDDDDDEEEGRQQRPSRTTIFTPNRPLCLWDGMRSEQHKTDSFGRCAVYARTSEKTEHRASEEQYHQDESVLAEDVWKDFCESHWPAIGLGAAAEFSATTQPTTTTTTMHEGDVLGNSNAPAADLVNTRNSKSTMVSSSSSSSYNNNNNHNNRILKLRNSLVAA